MILRSGGWRPPATPSASSEALQGAKPKGAKPQSANPQGDQAIGDRRQREAELDELVKQELAYLRQYARENGDSAAMLNAADTIAKLRRELDKLAEHVQHEEGTSVVDAAIRQIKKLEAQAAKAGEIAEIIARLKRECERQCDAEGPDADVVACSICATSKTISALEALKKGEN